MNRKGTTIIQGMHPEGTHSDGNEVGDRTIRLFDGWIVIPTIWKQFLLPIEVIEKPLQFVRRRRNLKLTSGVLFTLLALPLGAQGAVQSAVGLKVDREVIQLTLDKAVEQALRNNLTLQADSLGPDISGQLLREEQGIFDPVLEGRVNHNNDGDPKLIDPFSGTQGPASQVLTDAYEASVRGVLPWGASYRAGAITQNRRGTFNSFEDRYFSFLGVSLTQPILRGLGTGSALAGVRLAEKGDEIAQMAYRQAVIDTITGTILAYNTLLFARGTSRIAENNHQLALTLVEENEIRSNRGSMSEIDVLEARSRAARRETRLILARRARDDAENELKRILFGVFAPIRDKSLDLAIPEQAEITEAEVKNYMASAFDRRPDFRQARLVLERREINLSFERSQFLPQLDLIASYGLNGLSPTFSGSWDQVRAGDAESYSIGAVVSIPLPNRSASARKQAAALRVERSLLELKDLESRITVQLQNAAGQIDTSRERVGVSRMALDYANRNLVAEEKLLQNGASSTFLVLDRQERLATAQLDELSALVSLNDAVASFNRLAGRTNYDAIAGEALQLEQSDPNSDLAVRLPDNSSQQ